MPSVAVDKIGFVGKKTFKTDNVSLPQILDRIPFLKFWYIGSYLCDLVPNLVRDTFLIINTQPCEMQGEHWIMIANFLHQSPFADSLGRKYYSFLRKHYQRLIPQRLQVLPRVCGFYTIYAVFLFVMVGQEKIT